VAAGNGEARSLQNIWDWAKENLTTEELNNNLLLVKNKWLRTAWHVAAKEGNLDILKKMREWTKNLSNHIGYK